MLPLKIVFAALFLVPVFVSRSGNKAGGDTLYSGMRLTVEPPPKVEFVNTKGVTIECAATGNPPPKVNWSLIDGRPVTDIPGLREVKHELNDSFSSVVFSSFKAEEFRPDVHTAVYRCIAANSAGIIHSRNVHLHGVVFQNHEALVYDSYAIEGNSAVFKCHMPAVLKDYMTVIAWIKNDNLLIEPSTVEVTNGKFAVMPSGDLHIHDAMLSESGSRYKCKASHRLTGEVQISASDGQLFVTEARGLIAPKILESQNSVSVKIGETAFLACVSQGIPLPVVKWYKKGSNDQLMLVTFGNRYMKMNSAIVILQSMPSDSGTYTCEASSDLGKEVINIKLDVTEPVTVEVKPSFRKTRIGERVVLDCITTGKVSSMSWLHNGLPLQSSLGYTLVIESMQMTDRGMYQCFVKGEASDSAQVTAELLLSEIMPQFVDVFDTVTVRPGGSLTLNCSSMGIPCPNISFSLERMPLSNSANLIITSSVDHNGNSVGTITFKKITVADGGLYSCKATSEIGSTIHSGRINVYGSLGSRQAPQVFAVSGHNMMLNCPFYGYPVKAIAWLKDRKPLPFSRRVKQLSNGTLLTEDVDKILDAGIYSCRVQDNEGHQVHAELNVSVMVAPKIVPFEFQDELLREGMRARLQCVVSDGDLPLSVSWLKDGKPLSPELAALVKVLDEFSTILTINSITPGHNGKYTCVASNRAATVTHTTELSVNVPPKVVPFSFQDEHLAEGQLARVSCVVSRGDLPLRLQWEKDGVHIGGNTPALEGLSIKSFDAHSSILSIAGVSSEHNGLYTCVAINGAGSSRHSAQLTVNVPPQWIEAPEDVSGLKGTNVMLNCSVRGFPQPTISWMKISGSLFDEQVTHLSNGSRMQLLSNGSLLLLNIDNSDAGRYNCEASNGIRVGLNKEAKLVIRAPPFVKEGLVKQMVPLGYEGKLHCLIQGDSPLNITWYKDGKALLPGRSRQKIEVTNSGDDFLSVLTIYKVSPEDSATFKCLAENIFGTNSSSGRIDVVEPPNSPQEFKAVNIESQMVELSWLASFDGNDEIVKYIIQYKLESDSWAEAQTMETVNGKPTNAVINRLQPATDYIFRLFAENGQGRSPASLVLRVRTDEDVPSGVPQNLHVEPINLETFKIFWKAPERALWNGKVLGYYIGFKETDAGDRYLYKTLMTSEPDANDLYVQLSGLRQFTKYSIVVQAYNSKGKGPQTQPIIVMTSEGAPTLPPTNVRCTTLTSTTVHINFDAPPSDSINGILRGYKVSYKPTSELFEDLPENSSITADLSVTLDDLEKYTNYSIVVQAYTRAGESPRSLVVSCRTLDDVPGAPMDIKVLVNSESSVMVAWRSPENQNGVLKAYTVYWRDAANRKDVASTKVGSQLNYHEVLQLRKGNSYDFWVTASTLVGEGQPSRTVSQTPNGPKVAAKIVSFENKVVVSWKMDVQLACLAVGNPEPQRQWALKGNPIESNSKVKMSADGTLTLKDVREDNAGDYTCHVQNGIGTDKITNTVVILSPPTNVPIDLTSITPNSIGLKWKVPVCKVTKIKGYTLKIKPNDGEWKDIPLGPEAQEHKINSLDCGTQYEVAILAHNKIGSSAPSELLVFSTNGSVPVAPSKTDMIEETSSSVSLYLNTWKNNGCPIEYYVVECAPKSSNEWTMVSSSVKPEQRRLVIPNLKSATRYNLRMTAHNSAGSTVAKYEFATLTTSGATINPEVQGDAPSDRVDSLMTQLNFYLIVPVICTAIILLAVFGVAYMCIKLKKTDRRNRKVNQRLSAAALYELKRNDSSDSFNYMQRGSMCRPSSTAKHAPSDITPYATLQLVNRGNHMNTLGRQGAVPPLPPPRFDGFGFLGNQMTDPHFFPQPPNTSFAPGNQGPLVETTFVFPAANQMGGNPVCAVNSFPPGYKNDNQE